MNAFHYVMSHLKAAQIKRDERGVTAIEYGMIAALIAIVIIGSVSTIGTSLSAKFSAIAASVATTK